MKKTAASWLPKAMIALKTGIAEGTATPAQRKLYFKLTEVATPRSSPVSRDVGQSVLTAITSGTPVGKSVSTLHGYPVDERTLVSAVKNVLRGTTKQSSSTIAPEALTKLAEKLRGLLIR